MKMKVKVKKEFEVYDLQEGRNTVVGSVRGTLEIEGRFNSIQEVVRPRLRRALKETVDKENAYYDVMVFPRKIVVTVGVREVPVGEMVNTKKWMRGILHYAKEIVKDTWQYIMTVKELESTEEYEEEWEA